MKTDVTAEGARLLSDLLNEEFASQAWIVEQYILSLEGEQKSELTSLLSGAPKSDTAPTELSLAKAAENRLLDSPNLAAVEKVLLAAIILSEDFEHEVFTSRMLTNLLGKLSSSVNNPTAALNGLIRKEEVEVVRQTGHKRYRLTKNGLRSASELASGLPL